jgi:glutathione S-transferase
MIKVHGFSRVIAAAHGRTRDLRVLWALQEMQLPFEVAGVDHPAGGLKTEAYRRLSPFEQVPAIDDDGLVVSESAAIVVYLAKKSGRLMPADAAGEAQVLRWCFAAMNTVEPPLLGLLVLGWTSGDGCGAHREFMLGWANRVLGNLQRWLEGREFIATAEFSVADILMAHVLANVHDEALLDAHPTVAAYRARCLGRPAWQRALQDYRARVEAA